MAHEHHVAYEVTQRMKTANEFHLLLCYSMSNKRTRRHRRSRGCSRGLALPLAPFCSIRRSCGRLHGIHGGDDFVQKGSDSLQRRERSASVAIPEQRQL